eukprot:Amastigsp_a843986_32.p4 type:complete len:111 gc:universal Amastigsp_a843986_32:539-871(+)
MTRSPAARAWLSSSSSQRSAAGATAPLNATHLRSIPTSPVALFLSAFGLCVASSCSASARSGDPGAVPRIETPYTSSTRSRHPGGDSVTRRQRLESGKPSSDATSSRGQW